MGSSIFKINLGLCALIFMFTFQNSVGDSQTCSIVYQVGSAAYFNYINSSAINPWLEWRIETAYDQSKYISCNFTTLQCINTPEISAVVSNDSPSVLTIHQIMTNYKAISVIRDGAEYTICSALKIYAHPENVTCFVSQAGFNPPILTTNITKFFPKNAAVTYYMSNGTDVALQAFYCATFNDLNISTSLGTLPYYNCIGSWKYTIPSQYLRRGTNTFFLNTNNGGATDPGTNSSKTSIDIYPAISSLVANGSMNLQVSQGGMVILTCTVAPVPGENITLSRRNVEKFLNTTGGAKSVTYVISAFQCSDIDEYACTVDNGRWSNASIITVYSNTCPPQLTGEFQNNRTLTAEKGGSILLPLKLYSFSSVYAYLWFIEDGTRYAVPNMLYTTYSKMTSTYNYDLNVALLNLRDSDFRDYFLQIKNSASGDGINYYFTIALENSVDVRGAAIGVGVIAIALLIVVVILVLVMCHSRRKKVSHQPAREMDEVKPETYDSTGTSWGTDHKSEKTAASKTKLASHPLKTAISRGSETTDEQKYEPISENSKPHRPAIPLPQEEIYEIEPDDNSRPPSFYGNITEQPIYGNL